MNKIEVELIAKVGMNSIRFGMTTEEVRERIKGARQKMKQKDFLIICPQNNLISLA